MDQLEFILQTFYEDMRDAADMGGLSNEERYRRQREVYETARAAIIAQIVRAGLRPLLD